VFRSADSFDTSWTCLSRNPSQKCPSPHTNRVACQKPSVMIFMNSPPKPPQSVAVPRCPLLVVDIQLSTLLMNLKLIHLSTSAAVNIVLKCIHVPMLCMTPQRNTNFAQENVIFLSCCMLSNVARGRNQVQCIYRGTVMELPFHSTAWFSMFKLYIFKIVVVGFLCKKYLLDFGDVEIKFCIFIQARLRSSRVFPWAAFHFPFIPDLFYLNEIFAQLRLSLC